MIDSLYLKEIARKEILLRHLRISSLTIRSQLAGRILAKIMCEIKDDHGETIIFCHLWTFSECSVFFT